jgi:hypothetical protein
MLQMLQLYHRRNFFCSPVSIIYLLQFGLDRMAAPLIREVGEGDFQTMTVTDAVAMFRHPVAKQETADGKKAGGKIIRAGLLKLTDKQREEFLTDLRRLIDTKADSWKTAPRDINYRSYMVYFTPLYEGRTEQTYADYQKLHDGISGAALAHKNAWHRKEDIASRIASLEAELAKLKADLKKK